ncbi:MAG: site-specific integrase [Armatimonadota bacterium]|nr:site-specific integrase [Armatimonadota bacterium]MDR7444577.1 site-specific integrase [Armatimonadota bacterium]MDR7570257.1 site-specific integrase [Armatimonadota bacterium]MDR7615366.1 site-specific integrase [Armatimonadota bacterium]
MPGYIRRRGRSSWEISVRCGWDPARNRYVRVTRTVRGDRKTAERELAKLLHEVHTGGYVDPARITVKEFLEKFLRDYVASSVSPRTGERYREIIRDYIVPRIGSVPLHRLRPLHIQDLYTQLMSSGRRRGEGGLSAATVRKVHVVLHRAFNLARRWGLLGTNPCDGVTPPRVEIPEICPPDPEEVRRILEATKDTRLFAPTALAAILGLRRGEVLALKWSDVDLDSGTISITRALEQTRAGIRMKDLKSAKARRMLPLPSLAAEVLRAHRRHQASERLRAGPDWEDNDLVFPDPTGRPWSPQAFTHAFERAMRGAGIKVRFHDLRHHVGTTLLKGGVDVKTVSTVLGHSTPTVTLNTYAHTIRAAQQEALDRLDRILRSCGLAAVWRQLPSSEGTPGVGG